MPLHFDLFELQWIENEPHLSHYVQKLKYISLSVNLAKLYSGCKKDLSWINNVGQQKSPSSWSIAEMKLSFSDVGPMSVLCIAYIWK